MLPTGSLMLLAPIHNKRRHGTILYGCTFFLQDGNMSRKLGAWSRPWSKWKATWLVVGVHQQDMRLFSPQTTMHFLGKSCRSNTYRWSKLDRYTGNGGKGGIRQASNVAWQTRLIPNNNIYRGKESFNKSDKFVPRTSGGFYCEMTPLFFRPRELDHM